jgi:hypothetical protein
MAIYNRTPHEKKSHLGPLWVNAKSIMRNPWRCPIFRLCILFWEFANNNKCQVNYAKLLEMLSNPLIPKSAIAL